MLRIGKMTDYAFVVLQKLCDTPEESASATTVAERTGLPEPTASKVLKMLSKAGLVDSIRGAGGGYKPRKTACQLSVLEVIEAIEGRVFFVDCVDDSHECTVGTNCILQGRWDPINQAIRKTLSDWTIKDLMENQNQFFKQVIGG
tara:strand:+ start:128 stop:562 length:435 start_codon:yes stop_codon:yes gene_type:complete